MDSNKNIKTWIFSAISLLFCTCAKENYVIENLNGNRIDVLGHGGMGFSDLYPINTYESIVRCLSLGADGVELDIQMTADSVLVLFHSQDLSDETNLEGKICDLSWNEIQDAYYTATPYLTYPFVSLDDLLSNLPDLHDYIYTLDCKQYADSEDYDDTYLRALIRIIEQYQIEENVCIEMQSERLLAKLKQEKPHYKIFVYPSSFETGLQTALNLNLYGITIASDEVNKEQIQAAHEHGLRVTLWGMDSKSENEEAILKSPDMIQTDHLRELLKMLE